MAAGGSPTAGLGKAGEGATSKPNAGGGAVLAVPNAARSLVGAGFASFGGGDALGVVLSKRDVAFAFGGGAPSDVKVRSAGSWAAGSTGDEIWAGIAGTAPISIVPPKGLTPAGGGTGRGIEPVAGGGEEGSDATPITGGATGLLPAGGATAPGEGGATPIIVALAIDFGQGACPGAPPAGAAGRGA